MIIDTDAHNFKDQVDFVDFCRANQTSMGILGSSLSKDETFLFRIGQAKVQSKLDF